MDIIDYLHLNNYACTKDQVGRSKSQVYKLEKDKQVLYLKVGNQEVENLGCVLAFLEDQPVKAPKCLKRGIYQGQYYVLMTACLGTMTHLLEPTYAVEVLAKGLKQLHSLPIDQCQIIRDQAYFTQMVHKKANRPLSQEEENKLQAFNAIDLTQDLVFAHGDYCLPNILEDQGTWSFIDLDHGGISFKTLDLMDCLWSINYNFKDKKYGQAFLRAYGIDQLDPSYEAAIRTLYELIDSLIE